MTKLSFVWRDVASKRNFGKLSSVYKSSFFLSSVVKRFVMWSIIDSMKLPSIFDATRLDLMLHEGLKVLV